MITTELSLQNMISPQLIEIAKQLNSLAGTFQQFGAEADKVGKTDMSKVNQGLKEEKRATDQASQSTKQLGQGFVQAKEQANGLNSMVTKLIGTLGIYFGYAKMKQFANNAMDAFDIQNRVETQLRSVLKNVGSDPSAFDEIKKTASDIQATTMFGDEAMIGGAGELATYITDTKALQASMLVLSDYAAGMSGGMAVSQQEMVNYATQLGKALNGESASFDGLTKKGFAFSEAQKAILKGNSTDMEKIAVLNDVISASWAGLAEQFANTPQGKIQQFENTLGDIYELVGKKIEKAQADLYSKLSKYMPSIEKGLLGIGDMIAGLLDGIGKVADFVADNWNVIEPILAGIGTAILLITGYVAVYTAVQWAMNAALLACPFTWIAIAIGVIIGLIVWWINSVGGLQIAWAMVTDFLTTTWEMLQLAFLIGVDAILTFFERLKIGWIVVATGISNAFTQLKADVIDSLQGLVNKGIDIINGFIEKLNMIPGVSLDLVEKVTFGTEAQASAQAEIQANNAKAKSEIKAIMDEQTKRKQVISDIGDKSAQDHLKRQEAIAKMQADKAKEDKEGNKGEKKSAQDYLANIAKNMADTSGNTKGINGNTKDIKNSVATKDDEVTYHKDKAMQEVQNRFSSAQITITQGNTFNNNADPRGAVDLIAKELKERLFGQGQGIHA